MDEKCNSFDSFSISISFRNLNDNCIIFNRIFNCSKLHLFLRVQFKKPLELILSLICPRLDKDDVVFSNGPSTDPVECSVRSREGASIEFEMTVTDHVSSLSMTFRDTVVSAVQFSCSYGDDHQGHAALATTMRDRWTE